MAVQPANSSAASQTAAKADLGEAILRLLGMPVDLWVQVWGILESLADEVSLIGPVAAYVPSKSS